MTGPTPLEEIITAMIREDGPMPIDRYMALCLGHPKHGYYMSCDPFGAEGDFITAPEISQIFGELIGVWCAAAYQAIGAPDEFQLIELGPGRGTLMADILRAARVMPGFREASRIHLVESSPALREVQAGTLGKEAIWHDEIGDLPDGPSLIIANEFFDALPIRQYECRDGRWMERRIGLGSDGGLVMGLAQSHLNRHPGGDGTIVETSSLRQSVAHDIGARLASWPGAALIIDYGHAKSAAGDTLQAMRKHKFCGILNCPGQADLTSHVDFESLSRALTDGGATVYGPLTQRQFLLSMGLEARADSLAGKATPKDRKMLVRAVERLAGEAQMGNLFKVLAAASPGLATPYPFGAS